MPRYPEGASAAPPESVGIHMASVTEYSLSGLGPWEALGDDWDDEAHASVWRSPDPYHTGDFIYYCGRSGGVYVDVNQRPIYFAGTDPRCRGFPPPEEAAAMGTPFMQWESALSADAWAARVGLE